MMQHSQYFSFSSTVALVVVSLLATSSQGCADLPNWADNSQDTCATYAAKEWCNPDGSPGVGWLPSWGSLQQYANANGVDATVACCACGASGCADTPGWEDTENDTCEAYASKGYCTRAGGYGRQWSFHWKHFEEYAIDGVDVRQACCRCGKAGMSMATPACGTNDLFEYSANQRCQVPKVVHADISQCGTPPVKLYKMGACKFSDDNAYHAAVSHASPSSSTNSGKTCLIIDIGLSTVVLSVPHRAGHSVDCKSYCVERCSGCRHFDLTHSDGHQLLPGSSATFSIGGDALLYNLTYGIDVNCNTTDQYIITGPSVKFIAIPSFEGASTLPATSQKSGMAQSPGLKSRAPSRSPSHSRRPSAHPSRSPWKSAAPSKSPSPLPNDPPQQAESSQSTSVISGSVLSVNIDGTSNSRRVKPTNGSSDEGVPTWLWPTFAALFFAVCAVIGMAMFCHTAEGESLVPVQGSDDPSI